MFSGLQAGSIKTIHPTRSKQSLADHAKATTRLAVPVMLGRMGILVLFAVDTAMTGRVSAEELAFFGLAVAPHVPLLLIGLGLLMGTTVLTSQAVGAREMDKTGLVWRTSLVHAIGLGAIGIALCYGGEWFLLLTGQSPELAAGGGRVLIALGWSLPSAFLYATCAFYLEALNRPMAGLVAMIVANAVNIILNWLLIFGNGGLPALGAEGAAIATAAARFSAFLVVAGHILFNVDRKIFGIMGSMRGAWAMGQRLRRIGYPVACAYLLESGAFASMTIFAGWLGAAQVAGYQITINLIGLIFMGGIGFGTAGSVRVGNAIGAGNVREVRAAGWVAAGLAAGWGGLFAVACFFWPGGLASLYSTDPAVLAVAIPTIATAAIAVAFDCSQASIMSTLRGTADVWPATCLFLISFWGVMVPTGYWLAIHENMGAPGLAWSIAAGAAVAAVLLGLRFQVVSGRPIARA